MVNAFEMCMLPTPRCFCVCRKCRSILAVT